MNKNVFSNGFLVVIFSACFTTNASAFTAVTSGNWSSAATWGGSGPGTSVSNQDIDIPSGITVTMDMDITFSGLLNSFSVNGTLGNTSGYMLTISSGTFTGSGTIDIKRLVFDGVLITSSFNGTMTLGTFVNNGATLTFAAVINVTDSLKLEAGSITLGTGAYMSPQTNATIIIDGGTLTSSGGVFNSGYGYNVIYTGTSKTSGLELNTPSLKNIYVRLNDNTQSITLSTNLNINGDVYLDTGRLNINGRQLILKGDLHIHSGASITSNASSNIVIQRNASVTDGLVFTAGSSVNDLTIDIANGGNVMLAGDLNIAGTLRLLHGGFMIGNGSTLTMTASSTIHIEEGNLSLSGGSFNGAAVYDVEYMGKASGYSGIELSGAGIRNLTLNTDLSGRQINLSNNVTLSGDLNLYKGLLYLNNKKLIINGNLGEAADGMFAGSPNSELELNLTSAVSDTLFFDEIGNRNTLSNLVVNHTGGGNIVLGSQLSIVNALTLTSGSVILTDKHLVMESTAVINDYSDSKYVMTTGSGMLQMHINSASPYVLFPVGTASHYAPASIRQGAAGTSGEFMIRTMNGVFAEGTSGYNNANARSVVNNTWVIEAGAGTTVNMDLKLAWTAAAEVNGFNRNRAFISHYVNSDWDTYAKASATVSANSTYELERKGIVSLSPFSVADSTSGLRVTDQIIATTITIYPNPAGNMINILPLAQGTYIYDVTDMSGKILMTTKEGSSFAISELISGCYYIKATDTNTGQATLVPFIKY